MRGKCEAAGALLAPGGCPGLRKSEVSLALIPSALVAWPARTGTTDWAAPIAKDEEGNATQSSLAKVACLSYVKFLASDTHYIHLQMRVCRLGCLAGGTTQQWAQQQESRHFVQ